MIDHLRRRIAEAYAMPVFGQTHRDVALSTVYMQHQLDQAISIEADRLMFEAQIYLTQPPKGPTP